MNQKLPNTDVVLLGAGHTHAHVLRMWRMAPIRDARLTLVSDFALATYSGMLPGTLAGLYPTERMQIDLVRLCAAAGARLVIGEVSGLDLAARRVHFDDRPPLVFDVLSIGIGSVPKHEGIELDASVVLVKPMQTFLERLDRRLQALGQTPSSRTLHIAVVGGGAGGVEIAFCLPPHAERVLPGRQIEISLIDANASLAGSLPPGAARVAERELTRRRTTLKLKRRVRRVAAGAIEFDDGSSQPADLVVWATGAAAPPLLVSTGLPTDEQGFLLTHHTLKTIADAPVFAVGDTGSIQGEPTPKAGVYAVRQGPILWGNLHRQVFGRPLIEYRPQRGFLSLLATGDRRAILSYKGLAMHGGWCWRVKDRIDRRFMDKYQDYTPMSPADDAAENQSPPAMRCSGCGGKVGSSVLHNVLKRLEIPASPQVLLGLEQPDDAAILQPPAGPLAATVDFFAAFADDPYLVGRVAALNAASDLFAVGARPWGALAMATLPVGPARQQEQLLHELLAGGLRELRGMDATLVGGHTIEGRQTTIGFCMFAAVGDKPPRTKGKLRPGDQLVLTKPLGSGILLAAHGRAECRATWYQWLVAALLASNQQAAELADAFEIAAMTDVTGFGLAGHLLEMLIASEQSAELTLANLPLLPGAEALIKQGVESTLAPANRAAEASIEVSAFVRQQATYAALFDPQTAGGLLMAVPEHHVPQLLKRLADASDQRASVIGQVLPRAADSPRLKIA